MDVQSRSPSSSAGKYMLISMPQVSSANSGVFQAIGCVLHSGCCSGASIGEVLCASGQGSLPWPALGAQELRARRRQGGPCTTKVAAPHLSTACLRPGPRLAYDDPPAGLRTIGLAATRRMTGNTEDTPMTCRAILAAIAIAAAAPLAAPAGEPSTAERPSAAWELIRDDVFGTSEIPRDPEMISIGAPYRAHDAATVPVEIAVDPGEGRRVTGLTLVIDENPVPVAAVFEFGPAASPEIALSTRVRVNAYSNVRVIAELDDGTRRQSARFVKASGGCSAPAVKDPEAA